MITFEELAKYVANDFKSTMDEEGFETFNEMAQCYWWDSKDIRDEVDAILDSSPYDAYIDDLDGSEVFFNGNTIPYRTFSRMFRNLLK